MDHVAIMKKSWGLTEKILSEEKKIESRWYMARCAPWDRIKAGEKVYFKNSGEPIKIKAEVSKVFQFADLTPAKVDEILKKYGKDDGLASAKMADFFNLFKNKKYCLLIFLKNPVKIKPFEVSKKGFGSMSAWITVKNIRQIKI